MQKFTYHWRKSINITAWVIQLLVSIIFIGISAYLLALVKQSGKNVNGSVSNLISAGAGVNIAIGLVTVLFDILEIIFISRSVMKPGLYLSFACVKTLIWVVMFISSCMGAAIGSIIITLGAAGTSIMQLVYGSMIVHRNRKGTLRGGKYDQAATGHVEGQLYNPNNTAAANPPQTQGYENYSASVPAPGNNYPQQGYAGGAVPYAAQAGSTEYKSPIPSPAPQHAAYGAYAPPANGQGYYAPQQPQQYYGGGAPVPAGSYELGDQTRH